MALSGCGDSVQLRKATTCDSSICLSHGGGQNSLSRATTTSTLNSTGTSNSLTRSSKRRSFKVVKKAFVRNTTCFWFKSKSHVEAEYAYGASEESYQSSPETTRMNPQSLMLIERYNTYSTYISLGVLLAAQRK